MFSTLWYTNFSFVLFCEPSIFEFFFCVSSFLDLCIGHVYSWMVSYVSVINKKWSKPWGVHDDSCSRGLQEPSNTDNQIPWGIPSPLADAFSAHLCLVSPFHDYKFSFKACLIHFFIQIKAHAIWFIVYHISYLPVLLLFIN